MVNIIHDKRLINFVKEYDVVLVGTTINNSLGNGFQKDIERSFYNVSKVNKETRYGDKSKLGTCLVSNNNPIICLCYIYSTRMRPYDNPDVLDYEALKHCLETINKNFKGKHIASTIIGGTKFDGGGNPEKIINIMSNILTDVNIDIYDYEQKDYKEEDAERYHTIISDRKRGMISAECYQKLKSLYIWQNTFGLYNKMPDLSYKEIKEIVNGEKSRRKNE